MRAFLPAATTLACLLGIITPTHATADEARPNIVLMMADDLGWGDLHYMGNKDIRTPHLDAMAAGGLRFNRFYAAAPVCSPTRGSAITGRHPFRYGVFFANTGHMRPQELTLPELLHEHGYTTGHFGKWHLGTLTQTEPDANRGGKPGNKQHFSPPWKNGFDVCCSTESKVPTWDPMQKPPEASRQWWDVLAEGAESKAYGTAYWSNGKRVTENLQGDDSRVIMDRAIPFIREAVGNKKPFFTIVWFHTPHLPVVAGPKHAAMYSQFDGYKKNYLGCITALDDQVGRLRAELKSLGVAQDTMLWFCSDNGPEGNDKAPGSAGGLRGRKRSLFEGGVRVPGILEWPARVSPGQTTDVAACTSDYLPTIVDVLGAKQLDARPIDGVSLLPLIAGTMKHRPAPIAFESAGQLALSDNRYKLIHAPARRKKKSEKNAGKEEFQWMLFDLTQDQDEQHDIAAEHPDVVQRMSQQLLQWRASCRESLDGNDYP